MLGINSWRIRRSAISNSRATAGRPYICLRILHLFDGLCPNPRTHRSPPTSSFALFEQIAKHLSRLARDLLAWRVHFGELVAPLVGPGRVDNHSAIGKIAHFSLLRREAGIGRGAAHASQN